MYINEKKIYRICLSSISSNFSKFFDDFTEIVAVVAISSCAGRNTERKALEGEKRQCAGRMVAFRMGKCKSK